MVTLHCLAFGRVRRHSRTASQLIHLLAFVDPDQSARLSVTLYCTVGLALRDFNSVRRGVLHEDCTINSGHVGQPIDDPSG